MGFLSGFVGTVKVDLTDLAPADGIEYWVELKKSLTAAESGRAEDARFSAQSLSGAAGREARRLAARKRMGVRTEEDDEQVKTLLNFTSTEYKQRLLEAAVVNWNLTDEKGRPLPINTPTSKAASIRSLPAVAHDRLVEAVETEIEDAERTREEDADFRDGVPVGDSVEDL